MKVLRGWLEGTGRSVAYLLLAVALTWPLLPNATTHLPLGSERVATVPLFSLWILEWAADRITAGFAGFWDAPIFFPRQGAFALSEVHVLAGSVFAAIRTGGETPATAYASLVILALALNGLGAHRLAESLRVEGPAAYGAGVLGASLPFVTNELGVLQLVFLFPIFYALAGVARFVEDATPSAAISSALWVAVTILSSGSYGLMLSLFILLAGCILARPRHFQLRPVAGLLAGGALAALLVAPVVVQQAALTSDFVRGRGEVTKLSAEPHAYARLGFRSWGSHTTPWLTTDRHAVAQLYPGTALLFLGALGVFEGWRRRQQPWVVFSLVGIAVAGTISFGFNLDGEGRGPYSLLHAWYPGFERLRSPYRIGVFVQVFLVGLAALGLRALGRWKGPAGVACFTAVLGLGLLEVVAIPIRLLRVPQASLEEGWIDWLAAEPPGAVLALPVPETGWVGHYEPTVIAMLQGLRHRKPLVNGYSGFFPAEYNRVERAMRTFPDAEAWAALEALGSSGVRYVVARKEWLTSRTIPSIAARPDLLRVGFVGPEVVVFRLADPGGSR